MESHAIRSRMTASPYLPRFIAAERLLLALVFSAALHSLLLLGINYYSGSGGRLVAPDLLGAAPLQVRLDGLLAPPSDDTVTVTPSEPSPPSVLSPAESLPAQRDAATQPAPGRPHPEAYIRAGDLDVRPQIRDRVMPVYPETAGNLAGKVIIKVFINASGTVDEVAVMRADPPGIFDESAISAFGAARFTPGMKGQRAVKSLLVLEVSYDSADRQNAQPGAR